MFHTIKQDLHDHWRLRLPGLFPQDDIPAQVPGCVHTDLLAAGLIPEPYDNRNELKLQWIGDETWVYDTKFELDASLLELEHIELVCEGLDTVARLELNGRTIGNTENMHLSYRFDVKPWLKTGKNTLSIHFSSALDYANQQVMRLGFLPNSFNPMPYNFIRKMACNFGWDWGPALTTAGIWQPIYLEAWNTARLTQLRPLVTEANETSARLEVFVDITGEFEGLELTLDLRDPDGKIVSQSNTTLSSASESALLKVDNPQLWWCVGHGEQPLYHLEVSLINKGTILSQQKCRIGLRQVRLNRDFDDIGASFTLELNGKSIFCKGANWIPADCFVTRVTPERYAERIQQALDANMNMLRIWGGGIYENHAFYDLCDEQGIMVWQDFLFGCALYPEEPPFNALLEAEVRHQLGRLSHHASLMLWNGNNECNWGFEDWDWSGQHFQDFVHQRQHDSWGNGFYQGLIPKLVKELDSSRPYTPSSPFSGHNKAGEMLHPLDDKHGTMHVWDVWNDVDYIHYRDHRPRFAAEFGFQAPPTFATIRSVIPETQYHPNSPAMIHHQKAENGNAKLQRRLQHHFEMPSSFDDWHYLTQLNQVRALKTGIEWFRSLQPRCMGTLYWQLHDCWPVTSWSAVDGEGRKKPLWYATKQIYAHQLMSIQPALDTEGLDLCIMNDSDSPWQDTVTVYRRQLTGDVLDSKQLDVAVAPRSVQRLRIEPAIAQPENPQEEFLAVPNAQNPTLWFFERDKHLHYPSPDFDARLEPNPDGYCLHIRAKSLLRDVCMMIDKLDPDAELDSQVFSLLPDTCQQVQIRTKLELTLEQLTAPNIFYCANRFGKKEIG